VKVGNGEILEESVKNERSPTDGSAEAAGLLAELEPKQKPKAKNPSISRLSKSSRFTHITQIVSFRENAYNGIRRVVYMLGAGVGRVC
jgi:hypothetical protein